MLSGIIAIVVPLLRRYAIPALTGILGLIAVYSVFVYWKGTLIDQGYNKASAECSTERDEANTKAVGAYQEAVDTLILKNNKDRKEFENALYIYANRPVDVVIKRVPVNVKASCLGAASKAGGTEGGPEDTRIGGQLIEAELSPGAVRSIEEITNDIQKLQSECLLVKEAQRINQEGVQ